MTADLIGLANALNEFYAAVGQRIKAHRTAKGIVQADLAHAVGLSRPSVANIEAGRQQIAAHVVTLIAAALDITVADLLPDAPIPIDPIIGAIRGSDVMAEVEQLRAEALRYTARLDACFVELLKVAG
jgi:transcriptional regulator with XRE-family HTH domain